MECCQLSRLQQAHRARDLDACVDDNAGSDAAEQPVTKDRNGSTRDSRASIGDDRFHPAKSGISSHWNACRKAAVAGER